MYITSRQHSRLVFALRTARRVGYHRGSLRAMQIALATLRRARIDALTQAEADDYMGGLLDHYLPYGEELTPPIRK